MLQVHRNGRHPLDPNSPTVKTELCMRMDHLDWMDKKAVSWGYNRNQSIRSLYTEWVQAGKPVLPSVIRSHRRKQISFTAPQVLLDEMWKDACLNKQMKSRFIRSLIAWGMQRETITA